ncbi:MAG TPA: hypothetical protein VJM46_00985 [Candidatus Saccharimonadales bacterium]|nr:hypothetical protein [Candidatus Saccharimonadales bacterium]
MGFGNHPPPPDRRVPLIRFQGDGNLSFDEIVAALSVRGAPPLLVFAESERRILRGYAVEVDDSGIIRIVKTQDPTSGVVALVSREEGTIYGEFVDR